MKRVLVTCVGSGVGQSVLDSLNLEGSDFIIGCDLNRNVYAAHFCDEFHIVPGIYSEGYLDFILNLAIERKADIIIPGHDHELLLFSKAIDRFHEHGIEVLVSEPVIIEISRDKYLWYKYFSDKGCSIVPTYKVADFKAMPDDSIFPAIIKPAGGSASQGISIVHNLSELDDKHDDDIIQPYLFPVREDENYSTIVKAVKNRRFVQMSEISIQLIFGRDAKFKAIFISKNVLKNGIPVHVDPIQPEDFQYLDEIMKFVPICEAQGVRGPVNIQGRITDGGMFFFEMNMRFTGITGNRAQLGFNEVHYLVRDFLCEKAELKGYSKNKVGVRQVACTTINRVQRDSKPRVITILGGAGYFGSHFVKSISKSKDYEKIILVCRKTSLEKYNKLYNENRFSVYSCDDPIIQTVYNQTDILVNFASALANKPDEEKYHSILFQFEQIQKISLASIPLIINVSSQSVYDQTLNIMKVEEDNVRLSSLYSFQKYICEQFYKSIRVDYPFGRTISLRFPRILGRAGEKENGFFQNLISSIKGGQRVTLNNPKNETTLLFIDDAISALNFIIENENEYPEVLNVGGVNTTMEEFVDVVLRITQADPLLVDMLPAVSPDVSSQVDDSLFRSFGWSHKTDLVAIAKNIFDNL